MNHFDDLTAVAENLTSNFDPPLPYRTWAWSPIMEHDLPICDSYPSTYYDAELSTASRVMLNTQAYTAAASVPTENARYKIVLTFLEGR